MISATAEHAVRAVLLLARYRGAKALSADAIAVELGAPRNYLAKTLNALAKAGIVHSARGAAGGFTLAISPDELTLAQIIAPFDDHARTPACLLRNQACDPNNPCAIHSTWKAMVGHAAARFEQTTVTQLLDSAGVDLTFVPGAVASAVAPSVPTPVSTPVSSPVPASVPSAAVAVAELQAAAAG